MTNACIFIVGFEEVFRKANLTKRIKDIGTIHEKCLKLTIKIINRTSLVKVL